MNSLYLRSVELSNFRLYGDSFGFELPPTPSITIITGANGLGKTTFFDGIEWALTGEVSRLAEHPSDGRRRERDPLTRIGAPVGSHRVSLQFTDGAPIDRGQGYAPKEAELVELLRRPEWAAISNLHQYLSITHFLGQSSTQRFSVRKPREQWEALKGPAGVDRINSLRERVGGQGARQAFTRAIRDCTAELEAAEAALVAWTELLADRDRLRKLSASEHALSPAAVTEAVQEMAERLMLLTPSTRWNPVSPSEGPESALNRLSTFLTAAQEMARSDGDRMQALETLVADYQAAHSESAALGVFATEIAARRRATEGAISLAEKASIEAAAELNDLQQTASQAQTRAAALARVAAAVDQLSSARRDLASLDEQIAASEKTASQVQIRLTELSGLMAAVVGRRERRRILADQLATAKMRVDLSAKLMVVRAEIDRLSALASQQRVAALRLQRTALLQDQQQTRQEISRTEAELGRLDERIRAMSEAVAAIAAHLSPEDIACPVCASRFQQGQLLALAQARTSLEDPGAGNLAKVLADHRLKWEAVTQQLAETERQIAEQDQLLSVLSSQLAVEAELRQRIVEAGGLGEGDGGVEVRLQIALDELDRELATESSLEQLQSSSSAADADLQAEMAKRSGLQRSRTEALVAIEAARAALQQHPEFWGENGLLIDLATERTNANARATEIGARLGAAHTKAEDARARLEALRQQLATDTVSREATNARLNELVSDRQRLTEAWNAANLAGEPHLARLAEHRSSLLDRRSQLEALAVRQAQILRGFRRWLDDQALQDRQQRVDRRISQDGLQSEEEATAVLRERVLATQSALERAQRARARMEQVTTRMQARAEKYAEEVLQPLNKTIQRFARALMTWSDASIIYRAELHATRSELRPGVIITEADGTTSNIEMNPNLYFSEGQLSALSVSALLAASTTFSWSRWRGLLMDDPLQHNDVIHASAFMDLLRQMVRELDYQVILSTHDSAEADSLIRKCRSAGIPHRVHELLPHGDEGLISAVA